MTGAGGAPLPAQTLVPGPMAHHGLTPAGYLDQEERDKE